MTSIATCPMQNIHIVLLKNIAIYATNYCKYLGQILANDVKHSQNSVKCCKTFFPLINLDWKKIDMNICRRNVKKKIFTQAKRDSK